MAFADTLRETFANGELHMLHFLAEYGLFLAKTITIILAILLIIGGIIVIASKSKDKLKGRLEIKNLNEKYDEMADQIRQEILSKQDYKKTIKEIKKNKKQEEATDSEKKRIFVITFIGDIKASSVNSLRKEITALLMVATSNDEVVVILDSPGGVVPNYGLAASQLARIKQKNIPLTVAVDKVAASGGYLMACVANKILAAPFAIIGSIGVVAQIPNFHRLLKKNNIDFEQITAGEFKRTLTLFGENTEQGRKKVKDDVEDIQVLFKDFIKLNRPQVDTDAVATGEHWLAQRALDLNLVDHLITSDDYLQSASDKANLFKITYSHKKTIGEKISAAIHMAMEQTIHLFNKNRYFE
jgi:serine protease SohB